MTMELFEFTTDEERPQERGAALGERFREQIRFAYRGYEQLFDRKGLAAPVVQDYVSQTLEATRAWAPSAHEELQGMAEGAGMPLWHVGALTARTELLALAGSPGLECTTGVFLPRTGSREPHTLQTWDWLQEYSTQGLLLDAPRAGGGRLRCFAEFGTLGKIGVSDAGIGVHLNILNHVSDGGSPGVPIHVITRRILEEAHSVEDAVDIVHGVAVGASTALTVVCFREERSVAASMEISPDGVGLIRIDEGEAFARANSFIDPVLAEGDATPSWSSSKAREAVFGRSGSALALDDPVERAQALAVDPDSGARSAACVIARPELPASVRWETKLTIALGFAPARIEYAIGSPADVSRESWRRFPR